MMEEIIPNGTEVLIFESPRHSYSGYSITDERWETFIRGVVRKTYFSDDLSYHGSPEYVRLYEVIGEDGHTYKVSHFEHYAFNSYCLTIEEQIAHLKKQIIRNKSTIIEKQEKLNQEIAQIEAINIVHQNSIEALTKYMNLSKKSEEVVRALKK